MDGCFSAQEYARPGHGSSDLTSVCLLLHGWRPLISLSGVIAGVGLLLMSRSGVAVIGACVALAPLPLALFYRKGPVVFSLGVGLGIFALATILLGIEIKGLDVTEAVLNALGKIPRSQAGRFFGNSASTPTTPDPGSGTATRAGGKALRRTRRSAPGCRTGTVVLPQQFPRGLGCVRTDRTIIAGGRALVRILGALKRFVMHPEFIELWPVLFICFLFLSALGENELFVNHSVLQVLMVVAIVGRAGPWKNGSEHDRH